MNPLYDCHPSLPSSFSLPPFRSLRPSLPFHLSHWTTLFLLRLTFTVLGYVIIPKPNLFRPWRYKPSVSPSWLNMSLLWLQLSPFGLSPFDGALACLATNCDALTAPFRRDAGDQAWPDAGSLFFFCISSSHIVNSVCWSHALVNAPTSKRPASDGGRCSGQLLMMWAAAVCSGSPYSHAALSATFLQFHLCLVSPRNVGSLTNFMDALESVPTRPVPGTRPMNREPGSILQVLLPESEILWRDKQDRQEDLPLEMAKHFVRYALPTKLSRCNDNASPSGLRHRLRNRVWLCQDWQLSFYFRVPGYPTVTGTRFKKYPKTHGPRTDPCLQSF